MFNMLFMVVFQVLFMMVVVQVLFMVVVFMAFRPGKKLLFIEKAKIGKK